MSEAAGGRRWVNAYDTHVKPDIEIPAQTYVDLLKTGFSHNPERPALHYMGRTVTFRELDHLSARFASYLHHQGIRSGSVVGIHLPNIPEYLIGFAGALRAGCAVTGISPLLSAKELAYQLNDSGAAAIVIMDALFEDRLYKIKDQVPALRSIVFANAGTFLPPVKRVLGGLLKKIPKGNICPIEGKTVQSFKPALDEYTALSKEAAVHPADTCLIQYTGGTTGTPKGTVLTHATMAANYTQARQWLNFEIGEENRLRGCANPEYND